MILSLGIREYDSDYALALIAGVVFGDTGKLNRTAVGKAGEQRQTAAHRLDLPAHRGQQEVVPLLQPGDDVLNGAEFARDAGLSQRAGLAQLALSHFLGDQLSRLVLDPVPPLGFELCHHVVKAHRHRIPFSQLRLQSGKKPFTISSACNSMWDRKRRHILCAAPVTCIFRTPTVGRKPVWAGEFCKDFG